MNYEIWDLHCHLSGVPGKTPEERLAKHLEYADRMGLTRLCVHMGMSWDYDPTPDEMRRGNDEVLQAIGKFPDRKLILAGNLKRLLGDILHDKGIKA